MAHSVRERLPGVFIHIPHFVPASGVSKGTNTEMFTTKNQKETLFQTKHHSITTAKTNTQHS